MKTTEADAIRTHTQSPNTGKENRNLIMTESEKTCKFHEIALIVCRQMAFDFGECAGKGVNAIDNSLNGTRVCFSLIRKQRAEWGNKSFKRTNTHSS